MSLKPLSVSYGDEEIFDGIPLHFSIVIESEDGTVKMEMGKGGAGPLQQFQQWAEAARKTQQRRIPNGTQAR